MSADTKIFSQNKVDIILSPEFYWVRIFDIPVKTVNQARHVLPTLFEDIIETVGDFSYQAIKLEENKYLCFAYINRVIYEAIKNSGINLSLINSVYFAQNECKAFESFYVKDKSFVYTKEGILVKVPDEFSSKQVDLEKNINSLVLSSHKIDIKFYNNFISQKQIYILSIVVIFALSFNFIKGFSYGQEISNIKEKIEDLKTKNNLSNSTIQLNSILEKYKNIAKSEIKKRDFMAYIFGGNFKIKSLSLENKRINLIFEKDRVQEIKNYILKKYKIVSSNERNDEFYVEVEL